MGCGSTKKGPEKDYCIFVEHSNGAHQAKSLASTLEREFPKAIVELTHIKESGDDIKIYSIYYPDKTTITAFHGSQKNLHVFYSAYMGVLQKFINH